MKPERMRQLRYEAETKGRLGANACREMLAAIDDASARVTELETAMGDVVLAIQKDRITFMKDGPNAFSLAIQIAVAAIEKGRRG